MGMISSEPFLETKEKGEGMKGYFDFEGFRKIARLFRDCIITEKIDGTNATVRVEFASMVTDDAPAHILSDDGEFALFSGSRTRWISSTDDNFGFANWVISNKEELVRLGPGTHRGEWWGSGIQRKYGIGERKFSLFNTSKWSDEAARPVCCSVVPIVYAGPFSTEAVSAALERLRTGGSLAAPGFMDPEGVVTYHVASGVMFKSTIVGDEKHKGEA
jgi:hypothetical protein